MLNILLNNNCCFSSVATLSHHLLNSVVLRLLIDCSKQGSPAWITVYMDTGMTVIHCMLACLNRPECRSDPMINAETNLALATNPDWMLLGIHVIGHEIGIELFLIL